MSRALPTLLRAAGLALASRALPGPLRGDPVVLVVDQTDGRWMEVELVARRGRLLPPGELRALPRPRWPPLDEGDRVRAILDEGPRGPRLRRAQRLPPTP